MTRPNYLDVLRALVASPPSSFDSDLKCAVRDLLIERDVLLRVIAAHGIGGRRDEVNTLDNFVPPDDDAPAGVDDADLPYTLNT